MGEAALAKVDKDRRLAQLGIIPLLTCCIKVRQVLGDHVHQAGSLVTPERVRFDFSHFNAVTTEELQAVENSQ